LQASILDTITEYVRLYAVDVSEVALATTRANIERLDLSKRAAALRGDLLDGVPAARTIDWVLSNPPYVPSDEIGALAPEVAQWEPRLALDGGPDGLAVYRRLAPQAARRARRGVAFEVGKGQAPAVAALLAAHGLHTSVRLDLAGVERVVVGVRA
jgi:release factor glutamine methyltransferase